MAVMPSSTAPTGFAAQGKINKMIRCFHKHDPKFAWL
jgi:hypothetical protein